MPRIPPSPPGGKPSASPQSQEPEILEPKALSPSAEPAREQREELPQKFLPGTPVWTCTRSLLDVLAGKPGRYAPGLVQSSSFHLPHQRGSSPTSYTLATPEGGTAHCGENKIFTARPVPADAWTEPTAPGADFRSRYSGAPLRPNHGVITIVSQMSQAVAHSYVVFEWYDPFIHQRHHVLYHLFPAEHPESQADPTLWEKLTGTPGVVEKIEESHHFFPRADPEGVVIPAGYRSWETSYTCMERSRRMAETCHQNPPLYSAHGYSGTESCSTLGTKILRMAGINTRSVLGNLLEIPRYENANNAEIDTEQALWDQRYTPLPTTEYDVPSSDED